jgi:hypothetical protein
MIRLIFCIRRNPQLTQEQFLTHWQGSHATLVKRHAGTLGIREYQQLPAIEQKVTHAIQQQSGSVPAFDGIAIISFEDMQGFSLPQRDEQARQAQGEIDDDCALFIDLQASSLMLAQSDTVIEALPQVCD